MRSRLLAGALTLLPLLATPYLLAWAYRLLGGWAEGFLGLWGLEVAESLRMALPLAALTAFLGTAYLVGFLAERHLGRKLIAWVERPFLLLPGVRDIYRATGQIAQSLMGTGSDLQFSRAALIEYPRKGLYTLCFVVQPVDGRLPPLPEGYTVVLVPTSPVPASGMVVLVPSHEILPLEVPLEEALKVVVSGGFLLPGEGKGKGPRRKAQGQGKLEDTTLLL